MANPPVWTRTFTNGTVIPNYEAAGQMSNVWGGGAQANAASAVFTQGLPTTGFSSATAWQDSAKVIGNNGIDTASLYSLAPDSFGISGLTGANNIDGTATPTPSWTFITAPQNITWDVSNAVNRVDMFGTNNPPVVSGTKGMNKMTIGDALVEGFTRGVHLESKIAALESLMDYGINRDLGFVDVPVYQFNANDKRYGGPGSYYLIESVKIAENLRDLSGNITRAKVDITLIEVPEFQVSNGRDLASKAEAGAKAPVETQLTQATNINPKSGPSVPPSSPPKVPAGYNLTKTAVSTKGVTTQTYKNAKGQVFTVQSQGKTS